MADNDTCMSVEEARQLILDHSYIIDEFIGAGAMACVYKARERGTPNIYALKVLREQFQRRKGFVEIFEKEATHMRDLQYPNMVRFYKFVNEKHIAYILMDYVEGEPLTALIREARKNNTEIPIPTIVRIMAQIARAINYLHKANYIHRDIKPGNVLLAGEDQSAFLTDLGIAGAFDAQEVLGGAGTPSYMPYEQQIGANVDHTVDIYAFAIMLFEMFTGRKPFMPAKGLSLEQARQAIRDLHQRGKIPSLVEFRPDLPEELDEIFQHALAKIPADRYKDVMDFAQDIHEILKPQLPDDLKNFADIRPEEIKRPGVEKVAILQESAVPTASPNLHVARLFGIAVIVLALLVLGSIGLFVQDVSSENATVTATYTPSPSPTETPFLFGEKITVILENSQALGLADDLNMSLAYAVQHGGAYVPLRLAATDSFYFAFDLAPGTASEYSSYGIVFGAKDTDNFMLLRIDVEEHSLLLEQKQNGEFSVLRTVDIGDSLPNSVALTLNGKYLRFDYDEQVFQDELGSNQEGRVGLWLEIGDSNVINLSKLQIGLPGTNIENPDKFILPAPSAIDYFVQDIQALKATGDASAFVDCPKFVALYDKMDDYKDEPSKRIEPRAAELAQNVQDSSAFIYSKCIGADGKLEIGFSDYLPWEQSIQALLDEIN